MKMLIQFTTVLSAAALSLSLAVRPAFAVAPPDSTTIAKLLDQAKQHAAQANNDASLLDTYRFSEIAWQMHAQSLEKIKVHANDLFRVYYELQRIRDKGTPKQREAIDQLEPLLRDMATSLTNTFQALNAHQGRTNMPVFRTQIHADWEKINKVYEFLCECTSKSYKA